MAELVKASKETETYIAREAKGSQPQLWRYLRGEATEPKRRTLQPFARYFGIDVDAFYNPELASRIAKERGLSVDKSAIHSVKEPKADYAVGIVVSKLDETQLLNTYRGLSASHRKLLLADARKYADAQSPSKRKTA